MLKHINMGNFKVHGYKKFKDKSYSLRLNEALVERVKEVMDESPQNVIDRAYSEFLYLLDEIENEKCMEEL